MRLLTSLVAACLIFLSAICPARAKTVEETIELPVEVTDTRGRVVRHNIKVTLFRDDERARSPFLILNHGRAAKSTLRLGTKAASYADNARYFVAKGFAVFLPIRIGYGVTGGPDVEYSGACEAKNYPPVYEAAAAQTIKVIEYAKTLPYIDAASGLVVGQSFVSVVECFGTG